MAEQNIVIQTNSMNMQKGVSSSVAASTNSNSDIETMVHYDMVYSEVARIRQFIMEEIIQSDAYLTSQMIRELNQLRGGANEQFIGATSVQSEKIQSIVEVLFQLLKFMENTAFSYDLLDRMLAFELGTEGSSNGEL